LTVIPALLIKIANRMQQRELEIQA